jgi:hypothetical protein
MVTQHIYVCLFVYKHQFDVCGCVCVCLHLRRYFRWAQTSGRCWKNIACSHGGHHSFFSPITACFGQHFFFPTDCFLFIVHSTLSVFNCACVTSLNICWDLEGTGENYRRKGMWWKYKRGKGQEEIGWGTEIWKKSIFTELKEPFHTR